MFNIAAQETYHIFAEIFRNNKCRIVISVINAFDRLFISVSKNPSDRFVGFESGNNAVTNVQINRRDLASRIK